MARVFLSTLGTSKYVSCHYVIGGKESPLVVFVQEALVDYLCRSWSSDDRILIFCTKEAEEKNWRDGGNFSRGLESRLTDVQCMAKIEMVPIPKGRSEEEIMEIFLEVMNNLRPEDEVFMDITHSFRSIPLLFTIVLNYGKVVKEISVGGIFYGVLEVLGSPREAEKIPEDKRIVPVFDLTYYDSILDWARAVDVFKKAGYANEISQLINKNLGILFRRKSDRQPGEARKDDKQMGEVLKMFSFLKNSLEGLSEDLAAARGYNIYNFRPFSDTIDKIKHSNLIPPLKPLFDMLEVNLTGFEVDDPMERTFHAARWCVDHLMIAQAYVLLREAIITGLCECAGHDALDEANREGFWRGLLHVVAQKIPPDNWHGILEERKDEAKFVIERGGEPLKELASVFESVSTYRNDYLHGGWRRGRATARKLIDNVRKHIEDLRKAWDRYFRHVGECRKRAFVVLSHDLTNDQKNDLLSNWFVSEIVEMPPEVREVWENVSPDMDSVGNEVGVVVDWLEREAFPGDVVVVQGEYGATVRVADWARSVGLVPVYATTKRILKVEKLPDGKVKQERIFQHVRFRRFFA